MVKKFKRMTRAMAMSFISSAKCSFKTCAEIADYTIPFDNVSFLPIETESIIKVCENHKETILHDFPDAKFTKIPFIDGKLRKITCQSCKLSWTPESFKYGLVRYRELPKSCRYCHKKAWQAKQ